MQEVELVRFGRSRGDYPGSFPEGFIQFLNRNWGISNRKVLFPFGGLAENRDNWTVNDINEELDVDTHHDARDLPEGWTDSFDVVVSDPPYNEHYAEEYYDVEYPRPKEHLEEAARVVRQGGDVLVLDWLAYENFRPDLLELKRPKAVLVGLNQRMRTLNWFKKHNTLNGYD